MAGPSLQVIDIGKNIRRVCKPDAGGSKAIFNERKRTLEISLEQISAFAKFYPHDVSPVQTGISPGAGGARQASPG
jgi:hypothetical protein